MLNLSVIIKILQALFFSTRQCFMVEETTFINSVSANITKMKNPSYVPKTSHCTLQKHFQQIVDESIHLEEMEFDDSLAAHSSVHKKFLFSFMPPFSFLFYSILFYSLSLPPFLLFSLFFFFISFLSFIPFVLFSFFHSFFKTLVYKKFTLP